MATTEQKLERMLAHLIRNEGVSADAVERAVTSAVNMRLGEMVSLTGDNETMRRVFVEAQSRRILA